MSRAALHGYRSRVQVRKIAGVRDDGDERWQRRDSLVIDARGCCSPRACRLPLRAWGGTTWPNTAYDVTPHIAVWVR
jgi:hypothetical protein